ncbi:CHAD domain-containing protein [Pseudodonghicola flavimaris]|uniref:CHAD domain-containing protein n=1 Tax=Pseudodonghicola flavimaris TaxID=3050036 RepID=A0ABT7F141_9RHOB|nr:CHAD domain-containing protein [Pseudodonghicola flavimaris]MDK3018324.1 CHAD domain-containing protein [Pseudodonghicola flavimaris]
MAECFVLSGSVGDLPWAEAPAGGLRLVSAPEAEAVDFALLDCFDRPLTGSGRVLIEAGAELTLLTDAGRLAQTAARAGNFPGDLAPGPVRTAIADLPFLRSLLALGRGRMVEQRLALLDDQDKTQARARLWRLEPKGRGVAVTLVALQRLRGYDAAYDQLARRLRGAGPHLPLTALAATLFPGCPPYSAKPVVPFTADSAARSTATALIAAHLAVARQNEAGVIADIDTEFLHDYRVALRKVRSILSLFKGVYDPALTDELKRAFSDLMAPTGRLRDLDVYLLDRAFYFELLPDRLHPGLEALFALFAAERERQLAGLSRRLRSKPYGAEMVRLQAVFADPERLVSGPAADLPVGDFARGLIWKRYRKLCRIAREIGPETPDHEIHMLRINGKKLRYLMEFFAPLFPGKQMAKLIKPLKRLQDTLGRFNDYSVQQSSLAQFVETHHAADRVADLAIAQSLGALIAVLHQRQLEERARVQSHFADFDSPATRETFRKLFHHEATA